MFRRFGHVLGVAAEKLDADRTLAFVEVEILAGSIIPAENAFCRDELRHQYVGSAFLAELPENLVRHARHRGEIERKLRGREPGQRGIHRGGNLSQNRGWRRLE